MSFRHPPCAGVGRLRLQGKHVKALHEDIPVCVSLLKYYAGCFIIV